MPYHELWESKHVPYKSTQQDAFHTQHIIWRLAQCLLTCYLYRMYIVWIWNKANYATLRIFNFFALQKGAYLPGFLRHIDESLRISRANMWLIWPWSRWQFWVPKAELWARGRFFEPDSWNFWWKNLWPIPIISPPNFMQKVQTQPELWSFTVVSFLTRLVYSTGWHVLLCSCYTVLALLFLYL